MATADRILMLKLLGDTSSIDKSLRKTEGRLKGMGRSALSWGKAFTAGLVIEGIDKVTEALGDAWTGFREGEQAAAQLGTTWKNLGLDGSGLQRTIDQISASTLKLGTDDTEAINAFNQALQNTGGKPKQAMDRLRIAQDLVANGSAPNLSSALKIIDRAASGSAATVRKFGLKSETAAGRVKELGEKVKGAAKRARDLDPLGAASNAIAEGLESIVGSLAKGDLDAAAEGITAIGTALSTFGAEIAPGVTTTLDKLTDGGWSRFSDWVGTTFTPVLDDLGEAVRNLGQLWDELQPHVDNALTFIKPLIDLLSQSVQGGLGFVLDAVSGTLKTVTDLLKGDFSGAFTTVQETLGNLATDLDNFFGGLPGKFTAWAGDVLAGAGEVGSAIFDGIVGGIKSLASKVGEIINGAIGTLRNAWNGLDFAIPSFDLKWDGVSVPNPLHGTVADIFGTPNIQILPSGNFHVWDGTGDLIPDFGGGGGKNQLGLPGHEKGLWNVPVDQYAAVLHRGEMVLPADFAQQYRANGGGGMGGSTYTINVNVAPGASMAEAGRMIVRAIREYERSDGKVWRT